MSRITNDVNQVQQAVSETVGDLMREGLALVGLRGAAVLLRLRGWRWSCVTGAPIVVYPLVRLGQRVRRTTRRSQEELEHLSHVTAEAFTGHRIVKAFGAEAHEDAAVPARVAAALSHEHEGDERAVGPAAADGVPRRRSAIVGADLVRQPARSRDGTLTPGRLHRRSSSPRS